jgi:hypothetical protein
MHISRDLVSIDSGKRRATRAPCVQSDRPRRRVRGFDPERCRTGALLGRSWSGTKGNECAQDANSVLISRRHAKFMDSFHLEFFYGLNQVYFDRNPSSYCQRRCSLTDFYDVGFQVRCEIWFLLSPISRNDLFRHRKTEELLMTMPISPDKTEHVQFTKICSNSKLTFVCFWDQSFRFVSDALSPISPTIMNKMQ